MSKPGEGNERRVFDAMYGIRDNTPDGSSLKPLADLLLSVLERLDEIERRLYVLERPRTMR